jgi:hypothetical protein
MEVFSRIPFPGTYIFLLSLYSFSAFLCFPFAPTCFFQLAECLVSMEPLQFVCKVFLFVCMCVCVCVFYCIFAWAFLNKPWNVVFLFSAFLCFPFAYMLLSITRMSVSMESLQYLYKLFLFVMCVFSC